MIRPIDIKLNAAHPELPLVEATTFTGAPSSVFIRGVPKNCGNWSITAVNVSVTYPDNSTTTRAAVKSAEGVWVATIPGTATSGRTVAGFRILADGIDESGAAVTGYVLGFADFSVLSFAPVPAPGGTFWLLRYFDTMPTTLKKGDVAVVGGILKYYNGTAWLPFADLTNYYTKTETDNAIERVAAYYITANAQGSNFATRADLVNAQTYYSGGVVRVPTRNDYAVVLADETHGGAEYRYIYAVPDGETVGQWEPQYPIEGVIAYDNTVTRSSANGVKSSGIWSAIWGALAALPTGFTSLYDWCVAQIAKLRDKLDLAVYERRCVVSFPDGYSITYTYTGDTYTAPSGGESIEFYGPISSTAVPGHNFWVPYEYKDVTDFDPQAQTAWCLLGGSTPTSLMFRTGSSYSITSWNTEAPALTLSNGEATGDAPMMTRPIAATSDTLAKVSQMNDALAGKADDNAVVKLTGDQTIAGNKTFYGDVAIADQKDLNVQGGRVAVRSQGDSDVALFEYDRLEYSTDGGMTWTSVMLDNIATTAFVQGAVPYALGTVQTISTASQDTSGTETIDYGSATMLDRTGNYVAIMTALDELRVTFPQIVNGKMRDFLLRVEVGTGSAALTAPALVAVAPTGETITLENPDGTMPTIVDGTATAKGVTYLLFSESAVAGKFVVRGIELKEVA